ncbi:MAG: hypothetical protein RI977_735 [Bacteroidota bacterium]
MGNLQDGRIQHRPKYVRKVNNGTTHPTRVAAPAHRRTQLGLDEHPKLHRGHSADQTLGGRRCPNTEALHLEDIFEFNIRTPRQELEKFFKDIKGATHVGVVSEAGMPCIADPGALAVKLAHQRGWDIKPIMGPNSLMLALAGSGLSGQTFTFHGYPPINENELKQLTLLLQNKATDKHSHLFIETPYRTDRLLQFFCKNLPSDMLLCIARDLHTEQESIRTLTIAEWKKKTDTFGKSPCVFVVGR